MVLPLTGIKFKKLGNNYIKQPFRWERGDKKGLTIQQEDIQTFIKLGLTALQANVYLTIVKAGKATAKKISENTQIDRADTYRIIIKLQDLGLIKKIVSTPTAFTATPLQDALQMLLEHKIHEIDEIKAETKKLLEKRREYDAQPHEETEVNQFILLPSKEPLIQSTKKAIRKAQKTIDVFSPLTIAQKGIATYAEDLSEAGQRGVVIRVIVEKPSESTPSPKAMQTLFENQSFKHLFVPKNTGQRFIIIDKKEAFFAIDPNHNATESPALWTGNSALLVTIMDYFETIWNLTANQKNA